MLKRNKKKGFSLVELIVVIAVMAVLIAVLAPALLSNVEKSRMQKDSSALGEVTNAIELALTDEAVYDECLTCNEDGIPGKYAAADDENAAAFSEEENDKIRGMTITFKPVAASGNGLKYVVADGVVNSSDKKVSDMGGELKSKLEAVVGKEIPLTSQTYRNSDYTVFIEMSTLASGNPIKVHGEFNGTNLPEPVAASTGNNTPNNPTGQQPDENEPSIPVCTHADYGFESINDNQHQCKNPTCGKLFDHEFVEGVCECGEHQAPQVQKITFTIKNYNGYIIGPLQAEEGMTWEEFVDSDYCPGHLGPDKYYKDFYLDRSWPGSVEWSYSSVVTEPGNTSQYVSKTDVIRNGVQYDVYDND